MSLSRSARAVLLATQWVAENRNFPIKALAEAIVEVPEEVGEEGSVRIRIGVRNEEKEYRYLAFDVTPETRNVTLMDETD